LNLEELNTINSTFSETLKNSDLQNVSEDLAEALLDSVLQEGILKDIPVIGTVVGLGKTAISIKDHLFLKKIFSFLKGISQVPPEKRREMIDFVNTSANQKIKVGEKLIYILDKCDDFIDAKYIAQLFCAFLEKKISYLEYLQGAGIIQSISNADLEYYLNTDIFKFQIEASSEEQPNEDILPFVNVGICGVGYNPISVDDQDDIDSHERYRVHGGEAVIWVTSIGKLLKEILKIEK
jgi:hypothetical protein